MGVPDPVPIDPRDALRDPLRDTLVARLQQGDPHALETLYHQYAAALIHLATRLMGARELGADVVHDVFVALWERRAVIELRTTFQAYLFAAVRRHALNVLRHQRVVLAYERHADPDHPFAASATSPAADTLYTRDEMTAALRAAIAALPPKAREVAQLRWDDQLSRAEVAEVMGIAVSTVDNHLAAAIKALRVTLHAFYDRSR